MTEMVVDTDSQPDGPERSAYRRFEEAAEAPLMVLAVLLIPVLVVPEVVDLSDSVASGFDLAGLIIWAAFAVEFGVLFFLAPDKRRMLVDHWLDGVLVAVPFLRPLRILRAVRVMSAAGRAAVALRRVAGRPGVQAYSAVASVVIAGGAIVTYGFEREAHGSTITSAGDAVWWAIVTATTVGYGDAAPVTAEGRAVAVVLMLVGIGLLGVVTANIAAYFVDQDEADEFRRLEERLDRIEAKLDSMVPTDR